MVFRVFTRNKNSTVRVGRIMIVHCNSNAFIKLSKEAHTLHTISFEVHNITLACSRLCNAFFHTLNKVNRHFNISPLLFNAFLHVYILLYITRKVKHLVMLLSAALLFPLEYFLALYHQNLLFLLDI